MSRVKRLLVLFLKAENKPNDCFELTWSNLRIKVLFLFLFDIKILNFFLVHFPHYSFLSVGHSIFFFSPQDSEFTFCLFPHCFSLCLTSCYFIYLSSRTKFFQFGLWMKMSVACNAWCQIWFQEVIEINFYCIWLIWLVEHWFSRVMHNISNTFGLSRLFFFSFFYPASSSNQHRPELLFIAHYNTYQMAFSYDLDFAIFTSTKLFLFIYFGTEWHLHSWFRLESISAALIELLSSSTLGLGLGRMGERKKKVTGVEIVS